MATIVTTARWIETVHYQVRFDYVEERGSGFSFPCDQNGTLEPLSEAGQENYRLCLANAHAKPVVALGVCQWTHRYREPAVLKCDCGRKLSLADAMTNECECGRFYNGSGQSLGHPRGWGEETGERFDNHGHPIL